jgi:nucleotide-binding universal stress UspA family protein
MDAVVVGVDGSDASVDALRFAATEARLRDVPLRVVHAWIVPVAASWTAGAVLDPEPFERQADRTVENALAAVGRDLEGIEVETVIQVGSSTAVLFEHCSKEDLLVVGSRGRGGFAGLLLGSVSQQAVLHAPCPVVVVRGGPGDG